MRQIEVTLAERNKASRIIFDLRRDYARKKVAEILAIKVIYVTLAQNKTMRDKNDMKYQCPAYVIKKIIEHGNLLGTNRKENKNDY